jgi:hypothetical protein
MAKIQESVQVTYLVYLTDTELDIIRRQLSLGDEANFTSDENQILDELIQTFETYEPKKRS